MVGYSVAEKDDLANTVAIMQNDQMFLLKTSVINELYIYIPINCPKH